MEIINVEIGPEMTLNEFVKQYVKRYSSTLKNARFIVDKRNSEMTSINGSVYSKDMKTLILLSNIHEEIPYYMPDGIENISCDILSTIQWMHFSTNLTTVQGIFYHERRGVIDLRQTKCHCVNGLVDGDLFDCVRFPTGIIKTIDSIIQITENEAIESRIADESTIIAIFDADQKYTAPSGPSLLNPLNKFLNFDGAPLHFETIRLSETIDDIAPRVIQDNITDRFEVSPDNPVFMLHEGCLYKQTDEGIFLYHVPKDVTRLHILEGTTTIIQHAAQDLYLKEVVFPKTLKRIGSRAFLNCTFENDIEVYTDYVEKDAFGECHGQNIVFHGLDCTAASIFTNSTFKTIDMSNTNLVANLDRDHRYTFSSATIENVIFPKNITTIGMGEFQRARINKLDLSNTQIERISHQAFKECKIKEIIFPRTVTSIHLEAFAQTELTELILETDDDVCIFDYAFEKCHLKKVVIPKAHYLGVKAFYNNPDLAVIQLPESVQIQPSTFYKCPLIKNKVKEQGKNPDS